MTARRSIDVATARRLALAKQRLSGPAPRSSPSTVLDVVRSIRCVQLDPIAIVARSPYLVLRSRVSGFRPEHLDTLAYRDRALFEYWAHAASLVLTEDYPIHRYRMRSFPWGTAWGRQVAEWMEQNAKLRRSVLADLRRRAPLRSRDLADHSVVSWASTGWTRERNVDQMVRFLWAQGKVLVSERRGFEKWWDLAERVLPREARVGGLRDVEVTRRAADRSLRALGVATGGQIRKHFTVDRYPQLPRVLADAERSGLIERVDVTTDSGRLPGPWFVHRDDLALLERNEADRWQPGATLLSPFDNLIYDRTRAKLLFDLDYRMEIYVPKDKRRFGYYAMPLLHGDRFLGRVDPAADRDAGRLLVHAITPEPAIRPDRASATVVADAVHDLARWTGADAIEIDGPVPRAWRAALG